MQGLVVVGLLVEEILNVKVKCVTGTGAQNIGQGNQVKIPAKSVHLAEALPFPQNDGLKYTLHEITCKTAWHYM